MADVSAKGFPDVVTFAFWCRRANLEALAKSYDHTSLRVGLGLVFHISPSNVPINFAYSLVLAFLSGNSSVVRLPSRESQQTDLLIRVLGEVLSLDKFRDLRSAVHLVRYNRADPIT
ncbi:MAG: acyl-CoA reductase, partial [Rhodocyclaceae bacterium]|nr:acyl-CoA reductase [Rhodocyclaceae bacterium]